MICGVTAMEELSEIQIILPRYLLYLTKAHDKELRSSHDPLSENDDNGLI